LKFYAEVLCKPLKYIEILDSGRNFLDFLILLEVDRDISDSKKNDARL
jgi:hypothetical protein